VYRALQYTGFLSVSCSKTLAARVSLSPASPTLQLMINLSTLSSLIGFFLSSAIFDFYNAQGDAAAAMDM
jgi:hypothetical protein